MRFYTSLQVKTGIAMVTGIAVVLGGSHFLSANEPTMEHGVVSTSASAAPLIYLSTSTVPVRVSGVVTAADSAVIYAKTAGVITALPAKEGAVVTEGQLIMKQATPIADARVVLATAERELAATQQMQNTEVAAGKATRAEVYSYSATEIASLRTIGNNSRTDEVSRALTVAIEQGLLTAISAVQYVDQNRSLFDAEGMKLYDQVVTNIYGSIPNYFSNSIMRGRLVSENLQELLQIVRNTPEATLDTLVVLGTLTTAQLHTLQQLFATGESDVFDRQSTYVTEGIRTQYLTERQSVLAVEQSLLTTMATFKQVTDGIYEDTVGQKTNVAITLIDTELALLQARYAKIISIQAEKVSRAGEGVAIAEQSLGYISAPFAGTVATVLAAVGEYVFPGTPLFHLVGSGARELKVTIPVAIVTSVQVGQEFRIDNQVVGKVIRVSQVSEGGSGMVIIALSGELSTLVGTSLSGDLVTTLEGVFAVPRAQVFFDMDGPYIIYEDGEESRVTIVYDTGVLFFVTVQHEKYVPLRAATSISL